MSLNNTDVFQLANVLHQNGDKVLNGVSKLSLNAVFLQKLNKEFEILLENIENGGGSFEVTTFYTGNSQLLEDLLFLHDFVQKTVGLKLTNSANFSLLKNKVDISKFKSIKYLEIKKVPIKEVVGLKSIQSQLESIVCVRCLSKLEELLASCGGDNSSGFVWSELREAVLTFNDIKVVDTSIAFAPWLQVLDLSHNQISDVKAIECLPNLKYVNLSFNCLDVIPTFNRSARKKIELLVLKNNYIEDLSGLNGLCHLTELDLSNNWVSNCSSLNPLLSMATLQWLSLAGNPISYHQNYRRSVAGYLHISASFGAFYLDKIVLSKKEKSIVSINLSGDDPSFSKPKTKNVSRHSLKFKSSCDESNAADQVASSVRKSAKPRVVVIPNLDDGTYEEVPIEFNSSNLMNSSTEHLITKKRIENARSTFGVDNWLVQGSSVVQDILGLPPVQVANSTPYNDLFTHIALDSSKNVVTTTAVIETQPESEGESFDKNYSDPFFTCNESSSNFNSIENSAENADSLKNKTEEAEKADNLEKPEPFSKEVSPDIEKIQEEEENEINENEKLFVVSREIKTINNEIKHEELFLTITETELQEREPTKGKIVTKWSLSLLESCVKLKPNQLHLVFDIIRRDKRERTYSLEEKEANLLYKQIGELLESRTLSDMHQIVFKCENCSSQFSKEVKSNKSDRNKWCPFCNSKFILQLDEVCLPHSVEEKKLSGAKNSKNDTKVSHNRSSSVGGFFQNLLGQNEDKILKCSSQSSIDYLPSQSGEIFKSSAASLDELNELPTIHSTAVKRSDSDIEILSNPSQSSIEVIDGPGRGLTGNTPHRRRSSEEKQFVPPAVVTAAISLLQGGNPTGLTESSSSGSVTDSICTAYESSSGIPTIINKAESETTILENSEESEKDNPNDSEPILQEVLKKVKTDLKENKPMGLINYSYSDFTNIDHRIKLFLYMHVFDDSTEEFFFGLRAVVVPLNTISAFPSCIIASNKKLYFLMVTNIEHGDDARGFLQKKDLYIFNLSKIKYIYTLTWYQGFGVKIQTAKHSIKQFLILLKDSTRTKNFLEFLLSSDTQNFKDLKIIKEPLERPYMALQHLLLSSTSSYDPNIQYFCLFDSSSISDIDGTKVIPAGGLLISNAELLLFVGNLIWLADKAEEPQNPEYIQKFKNLLQVYSSQSIILLQFFDGSKEKEVWEIKMETSDSAESLLKCVQEVWEKIFSVPLQLSSI